MGHTGVVGDRGVGGGEGGGVGSLTWELDESHPTRDKAARWMAHSGVVGHSGARLLLGESDEAVGLELQGELRALGGAAVLRVGRGFAFDRFTGCGVA
jgi:hypothetical protein